MLFIFRSSFFKNIISFVAPQPMVKPDFFAVKDGGRISVILPKASEEFGPISHYYLVVVPEEKTGKTPDQFTLEEVRMSGYFTMDDVN